MDNTFSVGSVVAYIKADISQFKTGLASAKEQAGSLKGEIDGLGSSIKSMSEVAIAGFAVFKAGEFIKDSIEAFTDQQRVMAQTEAVIRSTGGAAGLTADEVKKMGEEIQKTTAISDDAAQEGMNMLLTFTQLGKENFPKATQAMLDMSTAMNGGAIPTGEQMRETAIQLGKAMNDPVLGMTALRRVGVDFTESQKEQIQAMVDANNVMGAQTLILNELNREFGGSATSQLQTYQGQLAQLHNDFNDMQKLVGQALTPSLLYLAQSFHIGAESANPLVGAIKVISVALVELTFLARSAAIIIGGLFGGIGKLVNLDYKGFLASTYDTMGKLANAQQDAGVKIMQIWKGTTDKAAGSVGNMYNQMNDAGSQYSSQVQKQLDDENQKFADANEKRVQDFKSRMADIVRTHLQKVTDIKQQLDDENKSFQQEQDDKTLSFNNEMQDLKDSHEDKVNTITDQLAEEEAKGEEKDNARIQSLNKSLADENASYDKQVQKNTDRMNQEMAQIKRDHDDKVAATQKQLDDEMAILNKHADDVKAVGEEATKDDIDRLHEQFDQENADAQKQHEQRLKDIVTQGNQQGAGYGGAINSGLGSIKPTIDNTMAKMGSSAGQNFANSVVTGMKSAGENMIKTFIDGIKSKAKEVMNAVSKVGQAANPLIDSVVNLAKYLPSFDIGGVVPGVVGTPQLVMAHGGETILPTHKTDMKTPAKTINQYNYNTITDGLDADMVANQLAFKLKTTL